MRLSPVFLLAAVAAATPLSPEAQTRVGDRSPVAPDTALLCLIADSRILEVVAVVDPFTQDTTIAGQPMREFYTAAAPPYLAGAEWYVRDEMVEFERRRYVRYGRPRVIRPAMLVPVGEFRGVPLFAASRRDAFRYLYVLVNPGCEFQPYWYAATVGEVRGK